MSGAEEAQQQEVQQRRPREHEGYQHQHLPVPAIYGRPIDPQSVPPGMILPHRMPGVGYPMEGVPLPPGIPGLGASTDPLEAVLGPFPCARLRNLPFEATLEDILVLFQGLVVIDVVIVESSEAFVIFANPMDFQMELQRDRQTIGRSFVEILRGSRTEYYAAIANQQWQEQHPDRRTEGILGMSGKSNEQQKTDSGSTWESLVLPTPIQTLSATTAKLHQAQNEANLHRRSGGGPLGAQSVVGGVLLGGVARPADNR